MSVHVKGYWRRAPMTCRKPTKLAKVIKKVYGIPVHGKLKWPAKLEHAEAYFHNCEDSKCTGAIYYSIKAFKGYSKIKQLAILKHEVAHAIQDNAMKAKGLRPSELEHDENFWTICRNILLDGKIMEISSAVADEFISCWQDNCIGHSTGD